MFEMKQVGRKIALKRKERNMTQMELADAMGVSFQAVSNWERGNSMPDISKLPELSEVLGLTIDALLTDGEPAKLVRHILDGNAETYVREEKVTADTVAQVAPILKPQQTEALLDGVLTGDDPGNLLDDLSQTAPFVSENFLHGWALKVASVDSLRDLASIAPHLSTRTLDALVAKYTGDTVDIRSILPLAPFLSKATLDSLAQQCLADMNLSDLQKLAPFLSGDSLDKIILEMEENSEVTVKQLTFLAPFLSKKALLHLAHRLSGDTLEIKQIMSLVPFLPNDVLENLIRRSADKASLSDLERLAPFASKKLLDELVLGLLDTGTFSMRQITRLAPFLSTDALDLLCAQAMEDADHKQLAALAPFLSKKTLHAYAEKLIEQHGLASIRDIAPFL